jgi:restriction system protein
MAVPDFHSFFKPLLGIAADGKEHSMKEARELIDRRMNIADADLREMLASGIQTKFGTALHGQRAILFRQLSWNPRTGKD